MEDHLEQLQKEDWMRCHRERGISHQFSSQLEVEQTQRDRETHGSGMGREL